MRGQETATTKTSISTSQVREDFDRIALLTKRAGIEHDLYHNYLLRRMMPQCESALEVGCGAGEFTRRLAARAQKVTGVDLSPQMLRLAEARSSDYANIEYLLGDVMQLELPDESFDCIVSIATLHHLSLDAALTRLKGLLKPGGQLVIHDLTKNDDIVDLFMSALARPVNCALRLWKTGRILPPKELRKAWLEHGKDEVYLTTRQVREICKRDLPGAFAKRHLLWRYTIVWRKSL
jgi:ubiquinone/menaquinone biosynthesis C-methylase UbiE